MMIKAGDKAKGFKFGEKAGDGSDTAFAIHKATGLSYHPDMDLYVGVEGEAAKVYEETFDVRFKNLRPVGLSSDYDVWTYPIADYLEIKRSERLSELGI